ncbi:hypothetical protein [Chengkuizengella sediminis]|uniref:hypothetical protein n=1 Tax=Chengkuizengella sediminis TaxID=1885917 RepID=UPI00138A105B|nr:hypothetical protein [Chengkuizengella sediminis]NDI35643.1 hypothetical protein [Chengkuizengella sediminis]
MGLNKGPFVVADTVSVVGNPYDENTEGIIELPDVGGLAVVVLSIDVPVKQPKRTKVSIDSMVQVATTSFDPDLPVTSFKMTYEILRNDIVIATINDEMDYATANEGRHTNFPNFPIVDNYPSTGINKYELRCERDINNEENLFDIFVASRSLKATVFTL